MEMPLNLNMEDLYRKSYISTFKNGGVQKIIHFLNILTEYWIEYKIKGFFNNRTNKTSLSIYTTYLEHRNHN